MFVLQTLIRTEGQGGKFVRPWTGWGGGIYNWVGRLGVGSRGCKRGTGSQKRKSDYLSGERY